MSQRSTSCEYMYVASFRDPSHPPRVRAVAQGALRVSGAAAEAGAWEGHDAHKELHKQLVTYNRRDWGRFALRLVMCVTMLGLSLRVVIGRTLPSGPRRK